MCRALVQELREAGKDARAKKLARHVNKCKKLALTPTEPFYKTVADQGNIEYGFVHDVIDRVNFAISTMKMRDNVSTQQRDAFISKMQATAFSTAIEYHLRRTFTVGDRKIEKYSTLRDELLAIIHRAAENATFTDNTSTPLIDDLHAKCLNDGSVVAKPSWQQLLDDTVKADSFGSAMEYIKTCASTPVVFAHPLYSQMVQQLIGACVGKTALSMSELLNILGDVVFTVI